MAVEKCHDCGVKPGEIHKAGCDWKVVVSAEDRC